MEVISKLAGVGAIGAACSAGFLLAKLNVEIQTGGTNMKRTNRRALIALGLMLLLTVLSTVTAYAGDDGRREIKNTFTFGHYAPEIEIRNAALPDRALTAKADGSIAWQKAVPGKWEQSWLILPASKPGYYIIREFTSEHAQRVITYTPQGFWLEYPDRNTGPTSAQMFRFKWYASKKAAGRTLKNVWTLPCALNNVCLCTGGWGAFSIYQTNWGPEY